ncbi:alpha/beta fold hydrolase [Halioxenophilus aromaticivorans]|uniref:Alpha/beta hydrolase n=1 Tax=Halioxenophilus aromaticivorans TaxID=1306992 RepID=A0AAV3U8Q6_9ALTE
MRITDAKPSLFAIFAALVATYTALLPLAAQSTTEPPKFDALLNGYTYPYSVKKYTFESQGQSLKMSYMFVPPKGNQPVVTLLHGKNFNAAYWQEAADTLQSLGYGVLMPDQIGFGKSSKPTDYQYSFAALANNTKALMDSLQLRSSIILGHSMGGMLATRFALLFPQATQQLILVNPIGLENYLQFVEYKDIDFFYQNQLKQTPEKVVSYQKKNYYAGDWNERYAALTEPLIGWINGPDWPQLALVSAKTYDMIFTGPVVEEFKDITVPTTLILGTRDRTGPGRNWKKPGVQRELGRYDLLGADIKKRNSDIEVIELEGLGHLPQIEDFERFIKALKSTL